MSHNLLHDLNEQQIEAVKHTEGPLLILAGAGTGKTKTLTTRLVYIIQNNLAKIHEVMCVTFTNKAAQEIENRIKELDPNIMQIPWIGTFHKIGAKILRRHAQLINMSDNFTILDKADAFKLLKDIQPDKQIAKIIAEYIEKWKSQGLLPDDISEAMYEDAYNNIIFEYIDIDLRENSLHKTYKAYQTKLNQLNCCDFNDLLLLPVKILQTYPDILALYQQRFKYIFVDEYQDTNLVQYLLIRLLAQKNQNICCVGDDDQAIYGWRGADVKYMLKFEKDFSNTKLIKLEKNYRSTEPILTAANNVIKENKLRLAKNLYPHNENIAPKISLLAFSSGNLELKTICEQILNLQNEGHRLEDIAIIVRLQSQLKELEFELIAYRIKHRILGESSFFEAKEIKDIIAYLRIIAQPKDDIAYERMLNTPKRGIGNSSLAKIKAYAIANDVSLYEAGLHCINENKLFKAALNKLKELYKFLEKWNNLSQEFSIHKLTNTILEDIDYIQKIEDDLDGKRRLNIKLLLDQMEQCKNLDLASYLQDFSLSNEKTNTSEGSINIMTIHAAKGLEFKIVFSPGWEENILPFAKKGQINENLADIEEERRLAYVVITRAKQQLYLSFSTYRIRYGDSYYTKPSRFLNNIPIECTHFK